VDPVWTAHPNIQIKNKKKNRNEIPINCQRADLFRNEDI
jgi:hypothetical protein